MSVFYRYCEKRSKVKKFTLAFLLWTTFYFLKILDYTCRARWPEGLLCSTISLKSCNLAQILQSPKSEIVTCVMFSTHTNTSLIKPHLTELDEIHRNRPKSNYNLAKNLQSWSFLERYIRHQTDRDSHIFYLAPPCRSRTRVGNLFQDSCDGPFSKMT